MIGSENNNGLNEKNERLKQVFFVTDKYKPEILEDAIKNAKENNEQFKIVSFNAGVSDELSKNGIQSKFLSYYCAPNFWENASKKATDWAENWPNQKIINGKSIKEEFVYGDCSLWWFGRDALLSSRNGIFDLFCYVEVFCNFFKIENPAKVFFFGIKDFRSELLNEVANKSGANFEYKGWERTRSIWPAFTPATKIKICIIRVIEIFYKKFALLIYSLRKSGIEKSAKKKVLILSDHGNYARTYWVDDKKYIGDFYYRGIEEALHEDSSLDIISISPKTPSFGIFSCILDFLEIVKGDSYRPLDGYINFSSYIKRFYYKLYFKKIWKKISGLSSFKNSLIFEGIDLFPFFASNFEKMFAESFPVAIGLLGVADNIINKEEPDIILTIYETSIDRKAIEVVARRKNIPVIGLQHGIISSYTFNRINYFHELREVWYHKESTVLQCPIPNKTLVFGEYFRNLLIKDGYPEDSVVATGCPRFDYFFSRDTEYSDKNNILFISEGPYIEFIFQEEQNRAERDVQTARNILQIINDDTELVIKVHPRDSEERYVCLLKEFPDKKIKIIKYGDLSALIKNTSVVVMKSSTVGIEAVIYKKPIINLSLFNEPQFASYYVQEGVAIEANDKDSLKDALDKVLNNNEIGQKLISNMDNFIKKFAFAEDGKSSLRVKQEIIRELSNGSNFKK